MQDQRQPFRFRLPWLSAMNAPRPTPESQPSRPTSEIQAPAQPTTTLPIQRPPFRPAGIAPAQPPPQAQPTARTESQPPPPPPPSRPLTESRVASQPASPSRAAQTRAASLPPSPTRGVTESRVASQPASPSRATTQTPVASQTRSPSRAATESRAASVPPSPSRSTQSATQAGPKPPSPSRLAPQSTGQAASQPSSPMRKVTQPQVQPAARAVSQHSSPPRRSETSQETSQPPSSAGGTTFKPDRGAAQPAQALGFVTSVTPTATVVPEAPAVAGHPEPLPESEKTLKEPERKKDTEEDALGKKSEDRKEVAKEIVREEKTNGSADERIPRTVTKLPTVASSFESQIKELLGARIGTEERKQEKHESFERKKPLTTSLSDEKQIKTVSLTHPKDRNVLGNHQKPDLSIGERGPLHKEIREDISKFVHKLAVGHAKQPIDDRPVSIITVAGENRGASMHVGSESGKKEGSIPIHRRYKIKSDEVPDTTTDGEGSSKGRNPRDGITKNDQPTKAYINNNTQSINNSILFNSSVNERNPGVQLVMSRNLAEPTKSTTKSDTLETRKAEFSVTPAENLTYQPTIRRRCLRGLFLEPSDSDPDNPEKPRRHGCLYNCGEKSKDKDIGVL